MRRRPELSFAVAALALAALAVFALPAHAAEPTPEEWARLRGGETLVDMADAGGGSARRLLAADAWRLFRAAADQVHYAEFFPFVEASGLSAAADGAVVVEQTVDVPWPYTDRTFAVVPRWEIETPAATDAEAAGTFRGRVSWRLVPGSGDVVENRGEWRFSQPEPGLALVEVTLVSDLEGVPAAFERRALAETLPYVIDGLRQQANRCRYDLPRHPSCPEEPPLPDVAAEVAAANPARPPER